MSTMLDCVRGQEGSLMFQLTPPQTKDTGIKVSSGCYCFVIDISGRHAAPPCAQRGRAAARSPSVARPDVRASRARAA